MWEPNISISLTFNVFAHGKFRLNSLNIESQFADFEIVFLLPQKNDWKAKNLNCHHLTLETV